MLKEYREQGTFVGRKLNFCFEIGWWHVYALLGFLFFLMNVSKFNVSSKHRLWVEVIIIFNRKTFPSIPCLIFSKLIFFHSIFIHKTKVCSTSFSR